MVRPLRIEYPGAWYHVMNRGLGRRKTYLTSKDRRQFLSILGETVETFHIEVHAYTLMDNHYHLLIHTPEMGLARAMRHINGVYTQKFNKVHRTDGPLFKGRYRAKLVDKDEYLLEVVRYIHMNAVDAGLVRYPGSYVWSSHLAYLQPEQRVKWLTADEVLGYFGKDRNRAVVAFDKFVRAGASETLKDAMQRDTVVIGCDGFRDWVYENFVGSKKKLDKEISVKHRHPRPKVKWKDVLSSVAFAYDVSESEFRSRRPGQRNEARLMAIYLIRKLTGRVHGEIAKIFGVESEYTIAKAFERFKTRLKWDRELKDKTDVICRNILYNVKT
ncbi:MAG: transposase [bacterium]